MGVTSSGIPVLDYLVEDNCISAVPREDDQRKSMVLSLCNQDWQHEHEKHRGIFEQLSSAISDLPQVSDSNRALFVIDSLGIVDAEDCGASYDISSKPGKVSCLHKSGTPRCVVLRRRKASACAKASRKKNRNR